MAGSLGLARNGAVAGVCSGVLRLGQILAPKSNSEM